MNPAASGLGPKSGHAGSRRTTAAGNRLRRWVVSALALVSLGFLKRFYLFIHETHRERQRWRQKEKQAPRRETDVGLIPRTPGSRPEPKADAQPPSHPGDLPLWMRKLRLSEAKGVHTKVTYEKRLKASCRSPGLSWGSGVGRNQPEAKKRQLGAALQPGSTSRGPGGWPQRRTSWGVFIHMRRQ